MARNGFDGGTAAATITTANAAGPGDDQFGVVTIGTSCTATFYSEGGRDGLGGLFTSAGTSAKCAARLSVPVAITTVPVTARAKVRLDALPTTNTVVLELLDSASSIICLIKVNTAGKVLLQNKGATTLVTSAATLAAGQVFGVALQLIVRSATVGQVEAKLYLTDPDSDVADETLTSAATVDTTSTNANVLSAENGICQPILNGAVKIVDVQIVDGSYPHSYLGAVKTFLNPGRAPLAATVFDTTRATLASTVFNPARVTLSSGVVGGGGGDAADAVGITDAVSFTATRFRTLADPVGVTDKANPIGAPSGARFGLIVADNSGLWTDAAAQGYNAAWHGTQHDLYLLAYQQYSANGTGPGSKFYDGGGGITVAWNNLLATPFGSKPNETQCTLCWKGAYNQTNFIATCRSALAKFPNEQLRIIYEQESDRGNGPTVADVQSKILSMYNTIAATSDLTGKVEIWLSLTGFNQYETPRSGKQLEDFIPNSTWASRVTGVSYDVYQFQLLPLHALTWTVNAELDDMLARCNTLGLALHIGEFGCTDLRPAGLADTDTLRRNRTKSFYDWCNAHAYNPATGLGCQGASYYENFAGVDNTTTTGPVGLLRDQATYPLTFAAVQGSLP